MKKEDHEFIHDMVNKLSKIHGYVTIIKMKPQEHIGKIADIEKANNEALELVKIYRARLESEEK